MFGLFQFLQILCKPVFTHRIVLGPRVRIQRRVSIVAQVAALSGDPGILLFQVIHQEAVLLYNIFVFIKHPVVGDPEFVRQP